MSLSGDEARWLHKTLKQIDFLSFCSMGEIERLAQQLTKKSFKKGETIVRQGDAGDFLFLLFSGEVTVTVKTGLFSKKELARLGPGNYFGEFSLINQEPRTASVTTTQETSAFLLFSADFKKLMESNTQLSEQVTNLMSHRRAEANFELRRQGMDPL